MAAIKNKQILDFIVLLRAIRWYNVLFILISQYLAALFIFNPNVHWLTLLSEIKLHLITIATATSVAGAFLVNGFYDYEKDTINRPKKVIFNRLLSTNILLNTYAFLVLVTIVISLFAGYKISIFFILLVTSLWFYSHKLSHIPFIREFTASALAISSYISIWLHYGNPFHRHFFVYILCIFTLLFTREIIKDLLGQKGNSIFGYKTIVEQASPVKALKGLLFLNIFCLFLALSTLIFAGIKPGFYTIISLFGLSSSLLISILCYIKPSMQFYQISKQILRIVIAFMVLSVLTIKFY